MAQAPIYVRQVYSASREALPLFLQSAESVFFKFRTGWVELRPPRVEGAEQGQQPDFLFCTVTVQATVSDRRKRLLDQIVQGRMPDGSEGPDRNSPFAEEEAASYASVVDEDGNLREGRLPPRKYLPNTLNDLLDETSKVTFELAEGVLRMIRWRAGLDGGPSVLAPHAFLKWSEDGDHWHGIWNGREVGVSDFAISPLRERWRSFVEQQSQPIREPLGHELFHEASRLLQDSPRSALLMVITAAEVGVKQCITSLVPDTTWLVENAPSPPVITLIRDYLPMLAVNRAFEGRQVCPPPNVLLEELESTIKARNSLTHVGTAATSPESLARKFGVVRDLLWLLDYYLGHTWAMEHVTQGTRDAFLPMPT